MPASHTGAWFESYLGDRTRFVSADGASSQGSVLGPPLFLTYLSSLGDIIRKQGLSFHLYAEDTYVYSTFAYDDAQELAETNSRMD